MIIRVSPPALSHLRPAVRPGWSCSPGRRPPRTPTSWCLRHEIVVLRRAHPRPQLDWHRPHRTLNQAAPLRPLPDGVTDLDQFRIQRRDRAGGVIHEYRLVA
jgi:hypothetical protein